MKTNDIEKELLEQSDDLDRELSPEEEVELRQRLAKYLNLPKIPYRRESPKIGRNETCPCGSGRKYKKCCGN